jgi:putative transposase
MAELRVYLGDTFLCRAINPELAGETIGLKDIIRARNRRRRELRTTLVEHEATIEALLSLRRGEEPQPEPLFSEPEPLASTLPARSRLKSYINE